MKRICREHSLSAPEPLSSREHVTANPIKYLREPNTGNNLTLPLAAADT